MLPSVGTGVRRLWEEGTFVDYTIEVEDREFKVHKVIMASVSDYFKVMLTVGLAECQTDRVRLEGLDPLVVSNIIEFIYTGSFGSNPASPEELLACAVYLQIQDAITTCSKLLYECTNLKSCLDVFAVFKIHSIQEGLKATVHYIETNIEDVIRVCEAKDLSYSNLLDLISLYQGSEWVLFNIIKDWVFVNYDARKDQLNGLMESIRYGLMSSEQLGRVKQLGIYGASNKGWQRLVTNAEKYHSLPTHQKVLDVSPQATIRGAPLPVCFQIHSGFVHSFYTPINQHSWKQHKIEPCAFDITQTADLIQLRVNNFVIFCNTKDQKCFIFDIQTRKWSKMARMLTRRSDFALVHYDKYLYALGGTRRFNTGSKGFVDSPGYLTDKVEMYSFETDTWLVILTNLPVPMDHISASVVNRRLYITGCHKTDQVISTRLDCLDLSTGTWSNIAMPDVASCVNETGVAELWGVKVLCIYNCYTIDYYDPAADRWLRTSGHHKVENKWQHKGYLLC